MKCSEICTSLNQTNMSYNYSLPRFLFFGSLSFMISCGDCDTLDCKNGGEWDELNCKCDCIGAYTGAECDQYTPEYSMHADVSADGDPSYSFDPSDLHVEIIDSTQDTIIIDGYSDNQPGEEDNQYLYFNIIVDDVYAVNPGQFFVLSPDYSVGKAWCSFRDPFLDLDSYTPIAGSSGNITLNTFQVGAEVGGEFDIILYNGVAQVEITGTFLGVD